MRSLLSAILILAFVSASAQDVILMRNGDEIQCKLLEISKNEVKYKRWTNQDGPTFTEKKDNIFMLKYENGEKEVVANQTQAAEVPVQPLNLSANTPTLHLLPDPTPISDIYLKYTHRGFHSGLIKYGHKQSEEQAQKILTTDWLEYKKARRDDKVGRVFAITGGAFFTIGLAGTVPCIVRSHQHKEAKKKYYNMTEACLADCKEKHAEYVRLDNKCKELESEYYTLRNKKGYEFSSEEEYQEAQNKLPEIREEWDNTKNLLYGEYSRFRSENYYFPYSESGLFDHKLQEDLWRKRDDHLYTRGFMIAGYAIGTPFLVSGLVKIIRGHKKATQIVNKHIEEHENGANKLSLTKPAFNVNARGNNLAFTLTF
ncbi:MAG: hypothetical protein MJZ19_09820 [Paludibacteraceae bacterium]|nr:hypothetical protein [Paludibacteraceae bacterium]